MKPFDTITNPRDLRRKLRLNQSEFWSKVGVTQSGGSRYETGRRMPSPVRELLRLVHVEGIVLAKAKGDDLVVGAYVRKTNPQLYAKARKAASRR
jgi:transcriptional regulator with XRE-family HTH domain